MTKIGFEWEFFSHYDQYDVEEHLIDIFGYKLGSSFDITVDSSLRRNRESRGMFGHEIITPPFDKKKAISVMINLNQYLRNIDAKFNRTTGFHINISTPNMEAVDPKILIACSDDYCIAEYFHREKNIYCRPWRENVKIVKEIADESNSSIKKEFDNLVSCFYNNKITSKVVRKAYKFVDPKYSSINIAKLKQDQYVEYRMIGGPNYINQETEIIGVIDHFILGQSQAKNKRNTKKVNQYLEWATA